MKGKFKKVGVAALALAAVLSLASCGGKKPSLDDIDIPKNASEFKAYALVELNDFKDNCKPETLADSVKDQLAEVYTSYGKKIASANNEDYATIYSLTKEAKEKMAECIPYANGLLSYASESNSFKTDLLGALEKYAVENGITGITLFENGNRQIYNERVTLGTENYISGYGFGTLAEGDLTADLATESNTNWKRYYHTFTSQDPGNANYMNSNDSLVSDFYGYFSASYFTIFMNETKDGYDWVPELAKEKPVAVNPDDNGLATKWKFPVRVGSELKYNTLSSLSDRAAFNNREVKLEDYETAFKLLLTQKNGYYRGAEFAGKKAGQGQIVGAAAYYQASANGVNEEAWKNVGIRTYVENGQSWLEYEYTTPYTPFYAMYYMNSSMYQPVPQDFIDLVTPEYYCGFSDTTSPVDNSLSLGAYTLERWDSDQQIVYKKNPNYVYSTEKYKIQGIHMNVLTAANSDSNAGMKEFLAGKIDACGIPMDYLDEYKNDPRTRSTLGDANFKLNVNACDQETWNYFFGTNGVISQSTDNAWECEPALSNPYFVKALSLSINRDEFASNRGSIASVSYLSSVYMSDPENGISYNATQAHKDAIASLVETNDYGYDLQLARDYFKLALTQLELDGKYTPGTPENPTVIELEICWFTPVYEERYHNDVAKYFEDAFNHESVSGGNYKLSVKFWSDSVDAMKCYDRLQGGTYDLGFGAISGNALNPLDFVGVLSSDQSISGNFTLNWGANTNDPDSGILVFDGMRWSFDALQQAGLTTVIVSDGKLVPIVSAEIVSNTKNTDGSYTTVVEVKVQNGESYSAEVTDLVLWWADATSMEEYIEESVLDYTTVTTKEDGTIVYTVTASAEVAAKYAGNIAFDVYFTSTILGVVDDEGYTTVYGAQYE